MNDCIFCLIAQGKAKSYKVYEDEDTFAFLDINQSSLGHTMVVLRKHGYSILDYSQEELGKIMLGVQNVAKKIKKAFKTDSITIGINHEEKRGVPHLHVHLIPRWDNDGGGIIQSIVKNSPKEPLEDIAEKLRKA